MATRARCGASELRNGKGEPVVKERDGRGTGIGVPRLLATGGADLVDPGRPGQHLALAAAQRASSRCCASPTRRSSATTPRRWRPTSPDADANLYNLYIIDPSENNILRYASELGGSGFSDVSDYLATDNEDVPGFQDMFVDSSLFTLTSDNMTRHYGGRVQDFELATPPDDDDMRPGHDYRFVAEYNDRFYVYDATWSRVLVFARATGDYVEQWQTVGRVPPMADLKGMYLDRPEPQGQPAHAGLADAGRPLPEHARGRPERRRPDHAPADRATTDRHPRRPRRPRVPRRPRPRVSRARRG